MNNSVLEDAAFASLSVTETIAWCRDHAHYSEAGDNGGPPGHVHLSVGKPGLRSSSSATTKKDVVVKTQSLFEHETILQQYFLDFKGLVKRAIPCKIPCYLAKKCSIFQWHSEKIRKVLSSGFWKIGRICAFMVLVLVIFSKIFLVALP